MGLSLTPQIELATDFLLSSAGSAAPAVARDALREAFHAGDFERARYWRAVRDRATERLIEAGQLGGHLVSLPRKKDNVIAVDFSSRSRLRTG